MPRDGGARVGVLGPRVGVLGPRVGVLGPGVGTGLSGYPRLVYPGIRDWSIRVSDLSVRESDLSVRESNLSVRARYDRETDTVRP